jgi:hypothetical protein
MAHVKVLTEDSYGLATVYLIDAYPLCHYRADFRSTSEGALARPITPTIDGPLNTRYSHVWSGS